MNTDPSPPGPPAPARPNWIWWIRPPRGIAQRIFAAAQRLAGWMGPFYRWWLAGVLLGTVPLLIDYGTGWSGHRLVVAGLLTLLLVAAVTQDSLARGLGTLGAAFLAHSGLAIALAACPPERLTAFQPDGAVYWERSHEWITTGVSPEYDLAWWLPAHFQLLGGMALFTYTSLGFVTLWQGLYEVDLMNCYVGQLLVHSQNRGLALAAGWHPWSLSRGIGYLFITFEVASFSFGRLTGVRLSTPRRRRCRWALGLTFLALDGILKFFLLEPVRLVLAGNLR